MNDEISDVSDRRLLVICDFHPALMDSLAQTLEYSGLKECVFLRKRYNSEWRHASFEIINLPLHVISEDDPPRLSSIVSLMAHVAIGTVIGIVTVLRRKLDTILGVFAFPQGLIALLVGKLTHRRIVMMTDGGDIDVLLGRMAVLAIVRSCLRRADLVTALNRTKRKRLRSLNIHAEVCSTFGVDTSRFRYIPLDQKEQCSVLYVGRLSKEKRPDLLLRACSRLRNDGFRFKLTIIGDGPLMSEVLDHAINEDMTDVTAIKGYVSHSDIHGYFQRNLVFVLPSIREGVSVSLLEAMSCGCLCVVSDIPDNRDVVEHMQNGIMFRVNDENDLAGRLRLAITESSRLASLGRNATFSVSTQYSVEAVANRLRSLLSRV